MSVIQHCEIYRDNRMISIVRQTNIFIIVSQEPLKSSHETKPSRHPNFIKSARDNTGAVHPTDILFSFLSAAAPINLFSA